MNRQRRWLLLPVSAFLAFIVLPFAALAVPYVPLEEAERQAQLRADHMPIGPMRVPSGLDELEGYVGTLEYFATLNWLTLFQVLEPGPNFGGQREGESTANWNIIQTDNTQEALRDWAWYARATGDYDRFETFIENAWTYTLNFPAYLEEGGGNPNYYRVHNCGWGLVAAMEYTQAYGVNDTYLAYGDSCARYLDTWRLTWSNTGVQLNPLAAGFGAGTLYLYGVWRENPQWIEAAQEIATGVKNWIDANPNRLNNNETWAMSGGTAMWGVVTALYSDDPEGGAEWIPTVSSYMDTYSGPGAWNNSWTVWYGHAWAAIHRVLGDQESYDNMVEVTEYLLDQVHLDDDAGLPGTQGQWADDQSWTSAYLLWYVLESLFEFDDIQADAVALDVVDPVPTWPVVVGNPIPVTVRVGNGGMQHLLEPEQVVSLYLTAPGGAFEPTTTEVPFGHTVDVTFTDLWTPQEPGEQVVRLVVHTLSDEVASNDTLLMTYTAVQGRSITGVVTDELNSRVVEAAIHWEQLGATPPRSGVAYSDPDDGSYHIEALPGDYHLMMIPVHAPLLNREAMVTVAEAEEYRVDFFTRPALVMLISEDGNEDVIETIAGSMIASQWNPHPEPYVWSIPEKGQPGDTIQTVDAVIWSSGDATESVLEASQYSSIQAYLNGNGGVALSGDRFMNLGDPDILRDLFHVEAGQMDFSSTIIDGARETYLANHDSLFTLGAARGQEVDGLVALGEATVDFISQTGGHPLVVSHGGSVPGEYRTVVMSFGIEAINSLTRFTTREEYLIRLTHFLLSIPFSTPESGDGFLPTHLAMTAHPNPFNPSLAIDVVVPGSQGVISVFDLLGRQIVSWDLGQGSHHLVWDAHGLASGSYFVRLNSEQGSVVRRVTLLR